MKLTPEQLLDFWLAVSRWNASPTIDDARLRSADVDAHVEMLIAHGIAQERARCAKVCRELAAQWVTKVARQSGNMCAAAIESPTEGTK